MAETLFSAVQEEAVMLVGYHYLVGLGVLTVEVLESLLAEVVLPAMGLARAAKFAYVFTH